jgi:2-methylisocitrate lyase-like PEP mutase family enzyme
MTQSDKARLFAGLHVKGDPVILYNIWDAGSAKAIADAGAKAIATGSWSVAAAQGFKDGEAIPLDLVLTIVSRIAASVDLPLTVDFEGGYAEDTETIAKNVTRLIAAGAIGVNFEDQCVGGTGLYKPKVQHDRVKAVRRAAGTADLPLFINARTDLFLKESARDKHAGLLADAKDRAASYKEAGADSFFVPGLVDPKLIADICEAISLPVNVMMKDGAPSLETLASIGVARISYGPGPYFSSMTALAENYRNIG